MNNLSTMMREIEGYLSSAILESAQACSRRLLAALPDTHHPENNRVLLAYGGGKDSSYMVAYVRYIQGLIWQQRGSTFQLRISTNRHAAMNDSVMENIDRVYRALHIHNDDFTECLVTDGLQIRPFARHLPMPEAVRQQNRHDVLMNGHRFRADARSTFCNACNLSMVNSFGLAAHYAGGVDMIITGDSPQEQTAYLAWARHLSRLFDAPVADKSRGFSGFLQTLDGVAERYFADIYGADQVTPAHRITWQLARDPLFFNIYQDTAYEAGAHWALLTEFMHFRFDELMFSFSESDCGNPTLMAHIRGLRAETLLQRSYAEGIREYVRFALGLMQQKDFPPQLIEEMAARYQDDEAIARARQRAAQFAEQAFGLNETQLVCMIYSPFIASGRQLAAWLHQLPQPPQEQAVRALLAGDSNDIQLAQQLEQLSGLTITQMRHCWRSAQVSSLLDNQQHDALSRVLRFDPHKAVIQVNNGVLQDIVTEVISGR
ncbi:hypothetical protein [Pantoea cypripedii]|uniref:PqqD family protein n=1 Tax=Pantoea cypripedii TaxID=55209 RepID=A0A1X1F0V3_PANCY|nr:hypothetical protein [Pantoea cypripedii]MBP2195818.1 hypothetical protein [Pantoea cypripedii]ORM95635.1 hypothetical protein HA50_20680 [Pantoea cypripedii]